MTIDELKAQIDLKIKSNGQRLITGAQLNSILNAIATYTAEVEGVSLKVPQFLPFDSIVANADVQVGSTSATDYEIVYVESKNVFTAYTGGVYYTDWVGSLSYNKGTFSKSAIATNLYINPYAEIYKIENSKLVAIQKYDIANVIATYGDGLATLSYKGSTIYPETKGSQVKLSIGKNAEDAIKQNGSNIVKEKERAQQVEMYLESQKADKYGYYENLSVGVSDNLSGRGEATESEFSMRPSGGENKSVQDGTARINTIKGNSVVWNNLGYMYQAGLVTISENNGVYTCSPTKDNGSNNGKDAWDCGRIYLTKNIDNIVKDHVYRVKLKFKRVAKIETTEDFTPSNLKIAVGNYYVIEKPVEIGETIYIDELVTAVIQGENNCYLTLSSCISEISDFELTDVTKMFNGIDVPTDIEEFYARCPQNVSNEYNAGTIIDNHTTAIKSVGVNAWDEQDEAGFFNANLGIPTQNKNTRRSKNYIKVIPNAEYYCNSEIRTVTVFNYDKDKNFIGVIYDVGFKKYFTIPANCHYVKLGFGSDVYPYTEPVKNTCINLSHTGYLNGKYFHYESQIRQLPTIEGGLKRAGSAFDEIRYNKSKDKWEHVQRIGQVDLGELSWGFYSNEPHRRFISEPMEQLKSVIHGSFPNVLCAKYIPVRANDTYNGVTGVSVSDFAKPVVQIYDPLYINSTLDDFKAAMQGVILYYELAEPIVTELDVDISPDYKVWDYGTEEAISEVLSTPVRINTNYGFNAVGQITDNTVLIKELLARVAVLEAQIAQANITNVEPIVE